MLTVGDKFPDFSIDACVSTNPGQEFARLSLKHFDGMWIVLFWWPLDFTFVCPTEVQGFSDAENEFRARNTQVLGASTDSASVHLQWRKKEKRLANVSYPMLGDANKRLASQLGILNKEKVPLRVTFVLDPERDIRFLSVNDMNVGRSVPEVLRVLDGLQNGGMCPCNWKPGQPTIPGK